MTQPPRKNLGRGLASLLGEAEIVESFNKIPSSRVQVVDITLIEPDHAQPRKFFDPEALSELESSIREKGVLQPILVRKSPEDDRKYIIVAGERRWRAATFAGLKDIPVLFLDLSEQESLEVALIENIQREDLNPIEEADGYKILADKFGYTQEEISKVIGKSRSHVANLLRLQSLPRQVREYLGQNLITMGHAKIILGVENQEELAERIIREKLSVRDTEVRLKKALRALRHSQHPRVKSGDEGVGSNEDSAVMERYLKELVKGEVQIDLKGQGAVVTIAFENLKGLDKFVSMLQEHTVWIAK